MALRVYAMSGRNKRLIYGLSIFNIIQGIFSIVLMALPGNKGNPPSMISVTLLTSRVQEYPFLISILMHIIVRPTIISHYRDHETLQFVSSTRLISRQIWCFYTYLSHTILSCSSQRFFFALRASRSNRPSHLLQALLRDGVLYFLYIFCANLVWLLCIKYARVSPFVDRLYFADFSTARA
jgi:hypothetical protein